MIELKPCPFCGGEAKLRVSHHGDFTGIHVEMITCIDVCCKNCNAKSKMKYANVHNISYETADKEAIEAWNRRVDDDENA